MSKLTNIFIIAVLLFSVMVSGCASQDTTVEEGTTETVNASDGEQNTSLADEELNEEMVGITDSEIEDLEAEIEELEALMADMELEEEIITDEI